MKPRVDLTRLRLSEIGKLIRARHGSRIPDPQDTDDRDTCVAYIRAAAFALSAQNIAHWCFSRAPWATSELIAEIEAEAAKKQRMMRADGVAGLLMVTMAERTRLGLRTIGACDMSKDERKAASRDRKRQRDRDRARQKRKPTTGKDRATYESESKSRQKPWVAEGISRRTWYRRRGTSASRIYLLRNDDILVPTEAHDTTVAKKTARDDEAPTGFDVSLKAKRTSLPAPSVQSDGRATAQRASWGLGINSPAGVQGGSAPLESRAT